MKSHPLFQNMTQDLAYDGKPAQVIELNNACGCRCVFMDIGATWLSCELLLPQGERREVLLGVANMKDFQQQQAYLGVIAGRYANRIAKAHFELEGKSYQLSQNQQGNCLHGGVNGLDKRRWKIIEQKPNRVCFSIQSPDGDQGFPGNLDTSVSYELNESNQIIISYQAKTDKATPVNLTNHAYFNLQGADAGQNCLGHWLKLRSESYLPVDEFVIPENNLLAVANTGFDFRQFKKLGQDLLKDAQQKLVKGYDHSFLLDSHCQAGDCAAELLSPDQQVRMKVFTDKPALQLYSGNWLAGTPNRSGSFYCDYAGVALETEFLPDSPNHPEWQQPCILKPGESYSYRTIYQFELSIRGNS